MAKFCSTVTFLLYKANVAHNLLSLTLSVSNIKVALSQLLKIIPQLTVLHISTMVFF